MDLIAMTGMMNYGAIFSGLPEMCQRARDARYCQQLCLTAWLGLISGVITGKLIKGFHDSNTIVNMLVVGAVFQRHKTKEKGLCSQVELENHNVICTEPLSLGNNGIWGTCLTDLVTYEQNNTEDNMRDTADQVISFSHHVG